MSVKFKKFNGVSDAGNVDFAGDNFIMILLNNRNDAVTQTISVLLTDGQTAVTHRIANNVPEETDPEEIVAAWIAANAISGTGLTATIGGEIFACHNIVGMGRPIILDNGVQLDTTAKGDLRVVSRFAKWFPEGARQAAIDSIKQANTLFKEVMAETMEHRKAFEGDAEMIATLNEQYKEAMFDSAFNTQRIHVLSSPYVAGMSKAYVSEDEKEIRKAFANSKLDFDKTFPDGLNAGADNNANDEDDENALKPGAKADKQTGRTKAKAEA